MKKLTETQAEILKQLNGLNTYPGLFGLISCFGILLALIGVLCPFFSYNPTVADDLKRTVSLFHLSSVALVVAIVGLLYLKTTQDLCYTISVFFCLYFSIWQTAIF